MTVFPHQAFADQLNLIFCYLFEPILTFDTVRLQLRPPVLKEKTNVHEMLPRLMQSYLSSLRRHEAPVALGATVDACFKLHYGCRRFYCL